VFGALALAVTAGARLATGARAAWGLCAAGILAAPLATFDRPPAGWMRVTMVDVGQGEAVFVQSPSGHALLVDAGGRSARFDTGDRIVAPALWASGVRRLDWLAITHADLDHIGGAVSVARAFRPREVWEGTPVPSDPERDALRRATASSAGVWRIMQRGDALELGTVRLEVLGPPLPEWERRRVRNDDSLVLQIRYGDVSVLLTGDVGAGAEATLPAAAWAPVRILRAC
jgi:competence protein ComEC